jgi:hypothetical protein
MRKAGAAMRALKWSSEALFDCLLFAVGVAVAAVSYGYGFGSLALPGPGLYPFFVGSALAACALVLLVSRLRSDDAPAELDRSAATTLVLMAGTFAFWIVAMPLLGYVPVTLLAAFAFCKVLGLEGWVKPTAVSIGTALFVYLLFDYWLYIDLPRGILG